MDDFRKSPLYKDVLLDTAELWCSILNTHRRARTPFALERTTHALPQLVQEMESGNTRWHRSRWCEATLKDWVPPSKPKKGGPHVEHPWIKSATKEQIKKTVISALERGVCPTDKDLIDCVASILDARCDTVLLPSQKTKSVHGILGGGNDGFRSRYLPAVQSGALRIWDRLEGREVTAGELAAIDEEREKQVKTAIARIERLGRGNL